MKIGRIKIPLTRTPENNLPNEVMIHNDRLFTSDKRKTDILSKGLRIVQQDV